MLKSERIVRYTAEEIDEMRRRGEDRSDLDALSKLTDDEIEASIDFEEEGEPLWDTIQVGLPLPKKQLTLRIDPVVLAYFKSGGRGYQTRINAVLRSYVEAQQQKKAG